MENNWDFFPDFSLFGEGLQGQWLNGVDNMVTREILEESARAFRSIAMLAAWRTRTSDHGDLGSHWEVIYRDQRAGLRGSSSLRPGSFFTFS